MNDYAAPDLEFPPIDDANYDEPEKTQVIPLGYDRGIYYYYSTETKQVSPLTTGEHSRAGLSGIASAAKYWEAEFQQFWSKQGFSWPSLADHLMTQSRAIGIYDPGRVRGRGAWIENKTPVLHIGDALIVNGIRAPLDVPGSKYIYEAAPRLMCDILPPLSNRDAHWLVKTSKLLRWEKPVSATLFAGWLAIAPICGALKWRPSVWITGSSGSGKSWIMEHIVTAILGEIALSVASVTSEAGIRQALQSDARPVIFDEAESETIADAARMQAVFNLLRVSSSENAPEILKGQQNQSRARGFRIRSAFLFQSINVGIAKKADESRVTILSLRDHSLPSDVPFPDLVATANERITTDFGAGLVSRSVSLVPVIRANSEIFARAVAAHLGSQRLGDQIGTLLAGAYSLHSAGEITYDEAVKYVAAQEWEDQTPTEDDRDEYRLIRLILASRLKIGASEIPVSRLIEAARAYEQADGMVAPETADRALREAGIKPGTHENVPGLFFSANHPQLKIILRGTPWESSWSRALSRLTGAVSGRELQTVRFSLGQRSRAVWVPLSAIDA